MGGLGEHVTYRMFWFLSRPFSFYSIAGIPPSTQQWTDFDIYTSYNVFACKEVPFGGHDKTAPHLGGQISQNPIFGREKASSSPNRKTLKLAYYQNYCVDSNQILHSDKDHQIVFMGGPNMCTTNKR